MTRHKHRRGRNRPEPLRPSGPGMNYPNETNPSIFVVLLIVIFIAVGFYYLGGNS